MAWGIAKAQYVSPRAMSALSNGVVRVGLHEFKPQELSNTIWAFAKVSSTYPALQKVQFAEEFLNMTLLFEEDLIRRAGQEGGEGENCDSLWDFKPQELSNTCESVCERVRT